MQSMTPPYPLAGLNPVIEKIPAANRPKCVCTGCEAAIWYTHGTKGKIKLYGHCRALNAIVYEPDEPEINNCSAFT